MAPRANWKGFLRLSLVTCPVALYPRSSAPRIFMTTKVVRARADARLSSAPLSGG